MKIQPLNNKLLIEVQKPKEKTKGGIFLDIKSDLIVEEAKVITTCKGSEIKKGSIILFKSYAMDTIEIDGTPFFFLDEDQVLGIKS
jgi:co-chaperonin GroES (HSP10)